MDKDSTFSNLAHDLTDAERGRMLERLRDITSEEKVTEEVVIPDKEETEAAKEPVIFELSLVDRIFIFFKALFTSQSYAKSTQEFYLQRLSKKLDRGYARFFSLKDAMFAPGFGDALGQIVAPLEKLRPAVQRAFQNRPEFIFFLAGWVLPVVQTRLTSETDPGMIAREMGVSEFVEIRRILEERREEIFQEISRSDREEVYAMVRALHSLQVFLAFPLGRFLREFRSPGEGYRYCPIREVRDQLEDFAARLASVETAVTPFLLEVLFLYGREIQGGELDEEAEAELKQFLKSGQEGLTRLRRFRAEVPFERLLKVLTQFLDYTVEPIKQGEDWFNLFRRSWDEKIQMRFIKYQWERRKEDLLGQAAVFLGRKKLEPLSFYSGAKLAKGAPLSFEISIALLQAFSEDVYFTRMNSMLKLIQAEGDFYKEQNQTDYNDAYNGVFKAFDGLRRLEASLGEEGEIGLKMGGIRRGGLSEAECAVAVKELLKPVERDMEELLTAFLESFDLLIKILGGILFGEVGGKYDSLANLSYLGGSNNERVLATLKGVYGDMKKSLDLFYQIRDLETK